MSLLASVNQTVAFPPFIAENQHSPNVDMKLADPAGDRAMKPRIMQLAF